MSPKNNEYTIPDTEFTQFSERDTDVIIDVRKSREGLDSLMVGTARQAVYGSYVDSTPTPEQERQLTSIRGWTESITEARRHTLDTHFLNDITPAA